MGFQGQFGSSRRVRAAAVAAFTGLALTIASANPAAAQRIDNGVAVFAALDKVTAKISRLPIKLGESVRFGALKVTPRACYTRQPTEPPKTTSFVEVDEIQLDGTVNRIFTGWMFAESPGLNAVEHPVFDVWLTECAEPTRPVAAPRGAPVAKGAPNQPAARRPAAATRDPDLPPGTFEELPEEPRRRPRR